MKYKAIIFDMDGTIIDTEQIWKEATKQLLKNRGIEYTPEMEAELGPQLSGGGMKQGCMLIKMAVNLEDDVHTLMTEKSAIACKLYEQEVKYMTGFLEFMERVQKLNLKVGLATNADDNTLRVTENALELSKHFGQHMYNVSHVNHQPKPDPAMYLHAAEQLGVDPEHCIAIEDSAHGIRAAKAANMFCIGYNSSRNHHQVKDSDLIVDEYHHIDLEELLGIKLPK